MPPRTLADVGAPGPGQGGVLQQRPGGCSDRGVLQWRLQGVLLQNGEPLCELEEAELSLGVSSVVQPLRVVWGTPWSPPGDVPRACQPPCSRSRLQAPCIPNTSWEHACALWLSWKGLLSQTPGAALCHADPSQTSHKETWGGTHCILASPGDVPSGAGKLGQGWTPGQSWMVASVPLARGPACRAVSSV